MALRRTTSGTLRLPLDTRSAARPSSTDLEGDLRAFRWEGKRTEVRPTLITLTDGQAAEIPTFVNEFWTSQQRVAHSLHEISYRACFKPQLPRFFLERLTCVGETVYDPFMGRGTTLLEAALHERVPVGCDVNPLSAVLLAPRLSPPTIAEVRERLSVISFEYAGDVPEDLLVFYHPKTLAAICGLRAYLMDRQRAGTLDHVDRWIGMVAVNRLSGHSPGFFSVYTLPPNQAASVASQRTINRTRKQHPPYRAVPAWIERKTQALLKDCDEASREALGRTSVHARLLTGQAASTPEIESGSVHLVVTSPPFLNVVNYAADNWLRCWFCGIDPDSVHLTQASRLDAWRAAMTSVMHELARVIVPGGWVAFEVGEVRGGKIKLEETVVPCGVDAGLQPALVLINAQQFTKTANVWGVANNRLGTNTNRVVVFQKP
jgi:hypothetical protein